jgi:putative component of membrane protein insertase Oxa1/YidC/SpoIIIJ protein YidD
MHTFISSESELIEKKWLFSILAKLFQKLMIFFISIYQKYISPLNGFSCAYRVFHRGESCSCYVKRTLIEQDLVTAIHMSRKRFRECSDANQMLKFKSEDYSLELNLAAYDKQANKGKDPLGRRKFVQNMMLGFTLPIFGQARFQCCFDMCAGSKEDDDQNK